MKKYIMDCETDGLVDTLTKLHCLAVRDADTGEVVGSYADQEGYPPITEGLALLSAADMVAGHNIIDFDLRAIKKVYPGFETNARVVDTLVLARSRFAHQKEMDWNLHRQGKLPGNLIGSHSLAAWGYRLGDNKEDYEGGWEKWSVEMQEYMVQDTSVTLHLLRYLRRSGISDETAATELALAKYLSIQKEGGWPFDLDKAIELQATLAARRETLSKNLIETFGSWENRKTRTLVPKRDNIRKGYVKGVPVEVTKVTKVEFNPSSRDHIAKVLMEAGWKPAAYTDNGKPQVDEATLKGMSHPAVETIREYLLVDKRLGQLAEGKEAWLKKTKQHPLLKMQAIHGSINQSGAVTHRASHSYPNISAVPKVGSPYGTECRSLFTVPTGWIQIGSDASGLELRCLAHYMAKYDDGAYGRIILEGKNEDKTDIHSMNQRALGLPDIMPDGKKGRDIAKTFIYAFIYGAGNEKLGSILKPEASSAEQEKLGAKLKREFLRNVPALRYLLDAVQSKSRRDGYLSVLPPDARKVFVRQQHAALNSLLQSAGAIICKKWIVDSAVNAEGHLGKPGWNGLWQPLGWIHDEVQWAVRDGSQTVAGTTRTNPEIVQAILVGSMQALTQHFNFRVPLDAEARAGKNWAETH